MGTGCGSARSRRIVTGHLLVGDAVQVSRRGRLAVERCLGHGRRLGIGRRLGNSLKRRESRRLRVLLLGERMEISLRCGVRGGRWCLEGVDRRRVWVGLGLRRLLDVDLRRLVERVVLQLRGSGSVLTEAAGLSRTVDLTQRVQGFALGVLQQVRLALRDGQEEGHNDCQHTNMLRRLWQLIKNVASLVFKGPVCKV